MAYEIVADSIEDREHWLAKRREGIGGSDIPAILGLSEWQSPLSVYVDKLGLNDDGGAREAQEWGLLLEPLILTRWGQQTERAVERAGKLLRSKEIPFAQATLDGVQHVVKPRAKGPGGRWTKGSVQIKNYGGYLKWSDAVPPDVWAQCQWEMGVAEYPFCSAVALLNGNKLVWADIEFDDRFFSTIAVPAAEEFWVRVQSGIPPAPDGSDISHAALKKLYPNDLGTTVELPPEFAMFDAEREEIKARIKEDEKRLRELNNTILFAIGDNTYGTIGNVRYTARWQSKKAYTVEASESRPLLRHAFKASGR